MSTARFICFSNLQPHSVSNGIDKFVGSGRRRRLKKLKKIGRRLFRNYNLLLASRIQKCFIVSHGTKVVQKTF